MSHSHHKLNMYEPAVFRIHVQGELDEKWFDYFRAQSAAIEKDQEGNVVTVLLSEPMDQAALVGLVNHLNALGIPLISVQCAEKQ